MEILCISKRSTEIPGPEQISLLVETLPFWMKLQLSTDRDRFIQLIQRFLARMKNGCHKILHDKGRLPPPSPSQKQEMSQLLFDSLKKEDQRSIEGCLAFVRWLKIFIMKNLLLTTNLKLTQKEFSK